MTSTLSASANADTLRSLISQAFAFVPPTTDWDAVLSDETPSSALLQEMRSLEPLALDAEEKDPGLEYRLFVLQNRLRLALRREAGLPLLGERTCGCCGVRRIDPVVGTCLPCSNISTIHFWGGPTLQVEWDVATATWSIRIRQYWDEDIEFTVANGFASYDEATRVAEMPRVFSYLWSQSFPEMGCYSPEQILDLSVMMDTKNLPFSADAYRIWLETRILSLQPKPRENPFERTIRSTLKSLLPTHD